MRKNSRLIEFLFYSLFTLTFLILTSCGGGESDSNTATSIPFISNLQYSPQTVTLNQGGAGYAYITGTINYVDQEGDLKTLIINVYNIQGVVVNTNTISLQNISGRISDSIQFYQDISIANIMDYRFDIYVTDAHGNISNKLTGTFRVTAQ